MFKIAMPIVGRPGPRGFPEKARPGGADISALTLARALGDRGYRVQIIVHTDGPTVDYVQGLGLEALVLEGPRINKKVALQNATVRAMRRFAPTLAGILRQNAIDAVHTNDASMHRTWGFYCDWLGLPQVWHERGLFGHPEVSEGHLRRAAAVVAISDFVKQRAPGDIRRRVEVIDNPIGLDVPGSRGENHAWLAAELGLAPDVRIAVMIANTSQRKRWEIFFEAGAAAARARRDLHFCCVGVANREFVETRLDRFWPADLRPQFHWLGYRYDVARILSGTDVMLATARDEPLGRTIVESLLAETPLLAAASGAHVELLKPAARLCLVRPPTPRKFADRLEQLDILERKYRPVAKTLADRFRARFDPDRHADRIAALYASALGGGQDPAGSPAAGPETGRQTAPGKDAPGIPVRGKTATREMTNRRIRGVYNTTTPEFAFICGGMRKIAVDAQDRRVRKLLLSRGFRYFSKTQFLIYACMKQLPIDVFLDIGVNFGECLFSAPLNGETRMIGFEPNPGITPFLAKSRAYNDDLRHVEIVHSAMSRAAGGTIDFHVDTRWSGKSSIQRNDDGENIVTLQVPTTTIDHEFARLGTPATALVKIDVEGHEFAVLEGAQRTSAEIANIIYVMEFDSDFLVRAGHDPQMLFRGLQARFALYDLRNDGVHPLSDLDQPDLRARRQDKIHFDLVMTRFSDRGLAARFESAFVARGFEALRKALWQI